MAMSGSSSMIRTRKPSPIPTIRDCCPHWTTAVSAFQHPVHEALQLGRSIRRVFQAHASVQQCLTISDNTL